MLICKYIERKVKSVELIRSIEDPVNFQYKRVERPVWIEITVINKCMIQQINV